VKILTFLTNLGLGGTEKAACRWACGLHARGYEVAVLTLRDGPRRAELESSGIRVRVADPSREAVESALRELYPEIIHAHAPGHPHDGDVLGEALAAVPKKIPVVQTNIFGKFENSREDRWTDFRLFISWTSCVQAARRSFQPLNTAFFRRASVAVYPLDPDDGPGKPERAAFRQMHGVRDNEVLFGRLSRPEPNKWTDLPLESFRLALRRNPHIKLLLREPPPAIAQMLATAPDRDHFLILNATSDREELRRTMASLDVVLHTSSIGESFGYGIAEPMNFGKPVIANSTPWADQAQIELVRHGECGFIAGTASVMANAMLMLAGDSAMRARLGRAAQLHIRALSQPEVSLDRLEGAIKAVIAGSDNPRLSEDLATAKEAAAYLETHQFGHTFSEHLALRPFHYRVRFHQWRKVCLFGDRSGTPAVVQ
jgi:glycosyltransferase involved in cell wall biosynthesis